MKVIEAWVLDNWIKERYKPNDLVFESVLMDAVDKLGTDYTNACEMKEDCCDD